MDKAFALYISPVSTRSVFPYLVIVQTDDEMQKGCLLHSICSVFPTTAVLYKDTGVLKSTASAFYYTSFSNKHLIVFKGISHKHSVSFY